jgi:tetratricopeptide (TPR) repeat protein
LRRPVGCQVEAGAGVCSSQHAGRPLLHQDLDGGRVAQGGAGGQRVAAVQGRGIARAERSGDAALCVGGGRVEQRALGEQDHRSVRRGAPRRMQPGHAAAYHKEPGADSIGHIHFKIITAPRGCQPSLPAGDRFAMRSLRSSRRATARLFSVSAASVASLTFAASLAAQPGAVAAACEIDTNSPKELLVASLAFQRAATAADPVAKATALKNTMKELTNKQDKWRSKNALGYEMLLAQTLSQWVAIEDMPVETTRGAIGATDMPEQAINLVTAADRSFTAVVEGAPSCAGDVRAMRQSEGWLAMTKKALDFSSSNPEQAQVFAQHSLTLLPVDNPYPYQVLGIVAQSKGDVDGAIANWGKAIEASGTDSTYADIRQSSLFYKGVYELQGSREKTGDEQQAWLRRSIETMKTYLADYNSSADAPTIMQGLAEAYVTLKETDKVPSIYAPMMASPAAYSDFALTMSGVLAAQAEKNADAVVFFEAALQKNPNQRDALRNLAASYYAEKRTTRCSRRSSGW